MRSLRFQWRLPGRPPLRPISGPSLAGRHYKYEVWTRIWHHLASMKGLQELHVKLDIVHPDCEGWAGLSEAEAAALLEPLMSVTTPEVFELSVPFRCKPVEGPWGDLPCQFRWAQGASTL